MHYSIQLFAIARERTGQAVVEVELPSEANIAELRLRLAESFPQLATILPSVRFAVNAEYVAEDFVLPEQAEIALIPPVSGG